MRRLARRAGKSIIQMLLLQRHQESRSSEVNFTKNYTLLYLFLRDRGQSSAAYLVQ